MTDSAARGPRGLALVSGGSGAIGEAITRQLHGDGWGVAIGYVSRERAEKLAADLDTDDVPAIAVPLDMSDPAMIRATLEELIAVNGRIDAAVYNGGSSTTAPFIDTTEDDWRSELAINFLGPVLATRLCLPAMLDAGAGVIIGISSDSAKVGDSGHAPYAAAKAAMVSFFKTIVREYGKRGIRANAVAPGPIDTPMLRSSFQDPDHAEKVIARLIKLVPVGRLGHADEVAAAVRYLVSDGTFVAGEHLSVGGGVTMQ